MVFSKYPWILCTPRKMPSVIINVPANILNFSLGKFCAINLPNKTPIILVHINAKAAPINTIKGRPDWAERIRVAICVLSPNSARNTLENVEINTPMKVFLEPNWSFLSVLFIVSIDLPVINLFDVWSF